MSIATKMSQVGKAIGYGVPKDGRNQAQNYDYTSAASVRYSVGPELAKRAIAVSSACEVVFRESFVNAKGNRQHHVMLRSVLTFVCGETGESMTVEGIGEGVDSGDKASAKAQTMAEKYAYVSAFTLAMGLDPEADEETDRESQRIVPTGSLSREEAARAEAQAAPVRAICDGFISLAQAATHADEIMALLDEHIAVIDGMGHVEIKRFGKAVVEHIEANHVEGMTATGFRESFKLVTAQHRRKAKEAAE